MIIDKYKIFIRFIVEERTKEIREENDGFEIRFIMREKDGV